MQRNFVHKLKAFADNKFNLYKMMISHFDRVENIMGKGENAIYQHVFLFFSMISKGSFFRVVNPFPNKPWFLYVCSASLLKTL